MSLAVWISVAVVVLTVFLIIKLSSEKQKVAVQLMLVLFVFLAITVSYTGVKYGVDITDYDSVIDFTKVYLSWLSNIADNLFDITGYAIHQDWGINSTKVIK